MTTLFISGIDTDVGKTVACGALAKTLLDEGLHVFTQKWVETGVAESENRISADLAEHQRIANKKFNTAEYSLHVPYLFKFPASPHLSADMENARVDCDYLVKQTRELESKCQHLLIEGAGGLCVPLNEETLTVDLVKELEIPIVLVTSGKLGSINHTLLSLDYCQQHDLDVRALIYNHFPSNSPEIVNDSKQVLQRYLNQNFPKGDFIELEVEASDLVLDDEVLTRLLRTR